MDDKDLIGQDVIHHSFLPVVRDCYFNNLLHLGFRTHDTNGNDLLGVFNALECPLATSRRENSHPATNGLDAFIPFLVVTGLDGLQGVAKLCRH